MKTMTRSILPDTTYGKWVIRYYCDEVRRALNDFGVKTLDHKELDTLLLTTIAPEIFPRTLLTQLTERKGFGVRDPAPFHPMEGGTLHGKEVFEGFCVQYVVHHNILGGQPAPDDMFIRFLQQKMRAISTTGSTMVDVTLMASSPVYVPMHQAYSTPEISSTSKRYALDELCTFILGDHVEEVLDLAPAQLRGIKFLNDCVRPVNTIDSDGHMYFRVNDPTPEGIERAARIFSRIVSCVNESRTLLEEYEKLFLEPDSIERLRTAKREFCDSLLDAGVLDETRTHEFTHLNSFIETVMETRRKEIDERKAQLPTKLATRFDSVREDIVQYLKREKYSLK